MKILIIGSGGFIGSHLAGHYASSGEHSITGCDTSPASQLASYFQVDKFTFSYDELFRNNDFDVCIYAGGNGSVPYSISNPDEDFQLNTFALERILSSIRKANSHCKFLHISSAAVYGTPEKLPVKEDSAIHPLSPYGWNKFLAEGICRKYTSFYGIPTLSMRVFSVYGERLKKQLFWDIYQKYLSGKEITLFGTGHESRDFIYISDFVRATEVLIKKADFNGSAINVAGGTEISIRDAAMTFAEALDPEMKFVFNNITKSGDPVNWKADISQLSKYGFESKISLREGLKNYAKWLRERE